MADLIERLDALDEVEYAESNYCKIEPFIEPEDITDDLFDQQWGLYNTGQQWGEPGVDIQAIDAWNVTTGDPTMAVGFIDFGTDADHIDFGGPGGKIIGQPEPGGDWNENHGTATAGVAAAIGMNDTLIAGVNWNVIVNTRSLHTSSLDEIANDLTSLVNAGCPIVNNSFGTGDDWWPGERPRTSHALQAAYCNAYNLGVLSIAAAGNENANLENHPHYPASYYESVMTVGAHDRDGRRWHEGDEVGSNYGIEIDFVAPGSWIYTLEPNDQAGPSSGTSLSAPFVTGIASLLMSVNPDLIADDIEWILKKSAKDIVDDDPTTGPGWDEGTGHGRVRAFEALKWVVGDWQVEHYSVPAAGITFLGTFQNVHFSGCTNIDGDGTADGAHIARIYRVTSAEIPIPTGNAFLYAWPNGAGGPGYSWPNPVVNGNHHAYLDDSTSTYIKLRTYAYEVFGYGGQYDGWFPCRPEQTRMGYTLLTHPITTDVEPPLGAEQRSIGIRCAPNPLRSNTSVMFTLHVASKVKLAVYDALGRVIRVLWDGEMSPGSKVMEWDGRSENGKYVPSGIYCVRLESTENVSSTKVVVIR